MTRSLRRTITIGGVVDASHGHRHRFGVDAAHQHTHPAAVVGVAEHVTQHVALARRVHAAQLQIECVFEQELAQRLVGARVKLDRIDLGGGEQGVQHSAAGHSSTTQHSTETAESDDDEMRQKWMQSALTRGGKHWY